MRVAVTGATGFLGAALCHGLAAAGHDVVAVIRTTSDQSRIRDLNPTIRYADVSNQDGMAQAFQGCDWLVHAAGRLGAFGISEADYMALHVDGTRNVLLAAQAVGIKRVMHVSSPGVLGSTQSEPKDESADYGATNRYERSKAAGEQVALDFAKAGLPVIVTRPEFVYGPGDTHVLDLFKAVQSGRIFLIDGGNSHCHPTYIDDAVTGMLLCLEKGKSGEIYHIAGQESLPMRDFLDLIANAQNVAPPRISLPGKLLRPASRVAEMIGERLGIKPPLTPSAVDFFSTSYRFSIEKARRELGYEPQVSTADGVARSVAWYRGRGWLNSAETSQKKLPMATIPGLLPPALAEGEGVGTAYEYFVKRRAIKPFLSGKQPKRILIAGLPETYGHSSDFFLLSRQLGAQITVIDERADKLANTEPLLEAMGIDRQSVLFKHVSGYASLGFEDGAFDLVLSSEVMQRLGVAERIAFSAELKRISHHIALFCPNGSNDSHVGRSGLNGLTLAELRALFPNSVQSGLIDMPPFPPGIALSEDQRESAESGKLQQIAMYGLQLYSYGEQFLPTTIRRKFAHIVYVMV